MSDLRDHKQFCIHGHRYQHPTPKGEGPIRRDSGYGYDECPGGAVVVLEPMRWCNTHDSLRADDDEFCLLRLFDWDNTSPRRCRFVERLVEVTE